MDDKAITTIGLSVISLSFDVWMQFHFIFNHLCISVGTCMWIQEVFKGRKQGDLLFWTLIKGSCLMYVLGMEPFLCKNLWCSLAPMPQIFLWNLIQLMKLFYFILKPHFKGKRKWLVRQDSATLDPSETVECIHITSFLLGIIVCMT